MDKPYSQACENNRDPILRVLRRHLAGAGQVLEIGSGTGQHAVYFARALPHLVWQPSDLEEAHAGIRAWAAEARLPNLEPPLVLDVGAPRWPIDATDAVFSANTAHIMSWAMVEGMFAGVGRVLRRDGPFCLYGPFRYHGHAAAGNARFDLMLRRRDPDSGLRDFEDLDALATAAGLRLVEDNEMPVNNRLLVWHRT